MGHSIVAKKPRVSRGFLASAFPLPGAETHQIKDAHKRKTLQILEMLYFAYGSMMDWDEIRRTCPSARFVAVAFLPDHQLQFTRRSFSRGCGVADAVPCAGKEVWGVIYDISESDLQELDHTEGYNTARMLQENFYIREQRCVCSPGSNNEEVSVFIYFAVRQPNPPPPGEAYKNLLVTGAKRWHLPQHYLGELERIQTC